jgi:hypothetical protein
MNKSRDNSVGMATGYGLNGRVSIPGMVTRFATISQRQGQL